LTFWLLAVEAQEVMAMAVPEGGTVAVALAEECSQ
jgi:hypothetical protein